MWKRPKDWRKYIDWGYLIRVWLEWILYFSLIVAGIAASVLAVILVILKVQSMI